MNMSLKNDLNNKIALNDSKLITAHIKQDKT